jgi:hypothetical protein
LLTVVRGALSLDLLGEVPLMRASIFAFRLHAASATVIVTVCCARH